VDINEAIEAASVSADRRRREDPELLKKRLMTVRTVVRAFIQGVISADTWNQDYPLPPRLESVVTWVAQEVARHFKVKGEEPFESSINESSEIAMSAAHDHPIFRHWGDGSDLRSFVDLEAVFQNMVSSMRTYYREITA
jgi:hypothetical protein